MAGSATRARLANDGIEKYFELLKEVKIRGFQFEQKNLIPKK